MQPQVSTNAQDQRQNPQEEQFDRLQAKIKVPKLVLALDDSPAEVAQLPCCG
jgi:hypothetical protein